MAITVELLEKALKEVVGHEDCVVGQALAVREALDNIPERSSDGH